MTACNLINKREVARAFNRAARSYDRYSALQKTVGHALLAFANDTFRDNNTVLDAGAGTGYFSRYFQHGGAAVTAADLAINMLKQAQKNGTATQYVACDLEALPFAHQQFSTTFSNLALQWCPNLNNAITELCRVTQNRVLFTTLVEGSLHELAIVGRAFDGHPRSNTFLPILSVLQACPKKNVHWQIRSHTLHYPSLLTLFGDLKGTGANYMPVPSPRPRHHRDYLTSLEQIYLDHFGRLQLTYRIFYGLIELST